MVRLITAILLFGIATINSLGLPSKHPISHDQYFIVPNNAVEDDYVGKFYTNFAYPAFEDTDSTFVFSIVSGNFNEAFSIDNLTGMITVNNVSALKEKPEFNLIVNVTSTKSSEEYIANIRVLDSQKCIFIDPDYSGSENGSRLNPYNSWQDVRSKLKGFAYLQKRGTEITIQGELAGFNDYVKIGAYGRGERPLYIGTGDREAVFINDGKSNVEIFDFQVKTTNTSYSSIKVGGDGRYFKGYRIKVMGAGEGLRNNNIYFYVNATSVVNHHYLYDFVGMNAGEHGIKSAGNNTNVINAYIFNSSQNGHGISLTELRNKSCKYVYVNKGSHGGAYGIECNTDSINIDFAYIKGYWAGICVKEDAGSTFGSPNDVDIKNLKYNGSLHLSSKAGISIEDNSYNISLKGAIIRNTGSGITIIDNVKDVDIAYCVITNNNRAVQVANNASNIKVNNIVSFNNENSSDYYGSTSGSIELRNSFYKNIEGSWRTASDIDLDNITLTDYFIDYEKGDFRLKSTAFSAINKGSVVGYADDIRGYAIIEAPEIGAYEYIEGDTIIVQNSRPIINKQSFTVYDNASAGSHIGNIAAFDNDSEQKLSYQILSGNTDNIFELSSVTGELTVNNDSGLLNNDVLTLLVEVTDDYSSPLSNSAEVTINIYHIDTTADNNPPVIDPYEFYIREEDNIGSIEMEITASDPDDDQNLTYSILSGNTDNIFSLNASTGILKVNDASGLDFKNETEFDLNIQVQDDGAGLLTDAAIVTIKLVPKINVFYIDPENTNDPLEDGSIDHPFNSWSDVSWEEGNYYLQKRGTTANESKINIYASNVTLGAYDEGTDPVINSLASDFAIRAFEKRNVTIQNLNIRADDAISCIYFLGSSCDSNLVENCHLEDADNAIRIIDGKTVTLKYNTFSNTSDAIYSYAETTKIYYNIFKENETGININSYLSSTEIYNNVFYDNSRGVSTSYSSLTVYNNIFYLLDKGDQAINHKLDNLISDNNIFYPEQDGFLDINDQKYSTLYDYQRTMGLDLNSFNSDPLFKDIYNDNFSVEPSSSAIDGGRDVGLIMDFSGISVPTGRQPDIGLIESLDDYIISSVDPFGFGGADESPLLYPNPSDGRFNISFSNTDFLTSELQIKDMTGNIIYRDYIESSEIDPTAHIDISDVSKGIYLVLIAIDEKVYTQRIVIN